MWLTHERRAGQPPLRFAKHIPSLPMPASTDLCDALTSPKLTDGAPRSALNFPPGFRQTHCSSPVCADSEGKLEDNSLAAHWAVEERG